MGFLGILSQVRPGGVGWVWLGLWQSEPDGEAVACPAPTLAPGGRHWLLTSRPRFPVLTGELALKPPPEKACTCFRSRRVSYLVTTDTATVPERRRGPPGAEREPSHFSQTGSKGLGDPVKGASHVRGV